MDQYLCNPPAGADVAIGAMPARLALDGISPNPMRGAGQITFSLPASSDRVRLSLYDLSGRLIRDFGDAKGVVGTNKVPWDGLDEWRSRG